MNFSFSGKHMSVGSALTHHAAEMCDNISAKYGIEFIDVTAVMEKDSFLFKTDISIETSGGDIFHAKSEEKEPYHSFDSALHKITAQIRKAKSKAAEHHSESIRHTYDAENPAESRITFVQETVEAVLLSPEEAAELLSQSQNPLVVFRNKFSNDINIVYTDYNGVPHLVSYK